MRLQTILTLCITTLLAGCTIEKPISSSEHATTQTPTPQISTDPTLTPIEKHGPLHVEGAFLYDQNDESYQLYGMSTHGIAWFPEYVNMDTFHTLRNDWGTNCVRLAMYTHENGGYCTDGNPDALLHLIDQGVNAATEQGMYVIIDWHVLNEQNPLVYADQAEEFFKTVASRYQNYDNVLYEICNEPNGSATWNDVSVYADRIIPIIRQFDTDAVILVGSPTWSQDIQLALSSPLSYDNIMYTVHFYAATHTQWLRDRVSDCIEHGLPVFISEFGTCDASGNGAINLEEAGKWKALIDQYHLSYICWNLANKAETSSVLKPDCTKIADWSSDDLSEQGKLVSGWFQSEQNP